jgi:phage tail sheath protein FI
MPSYLTPGVYVEEVSTGAKPIGMVGTSTAAFVGGLPNSNHLNEAVACNNWTQFVKHFVADGDPGSDLARAVYGFFDNGGSRCYVVNVGKGKPISGDKRKRTGLDCLEAIDEIAIVAAPGYCDPGSYAALLSHCENLKDRVAILDTPSVVKDIDTLKEVGTTGAGGGESGEGEAGGGGKKASRGIRPPNSDGGFGSLYFPWLNVRDPLSSGQVVQVPPSGHMAGIYARSDATRGVHKAPANETVRGALGLAYQVTHAEQGELNRKGVNCIRFFPDSGIRVWGARTLAEESSEWRYINVRRLFNMIEESIKEGTRWTVFEPNDERLWKSVVRDSIAFLTLVWRDGALKGTTPQEAFFVKCDAETNPPEVIDAGRLVVEIGIAPVKPSEFIIFRIGQWSGGASAEEESAEGESEE